MEFYESITNVKNNPIIERIATALKNIDLESVEKGSHYVDDTFYYNVIEYQSTTSENREWESHKREYDIHFLISGEERIYHNFLSEMTLKEYDEKGDWQQMTGEHASELVLKPGNVLILDTNDAHKTGLMVNKPVDIKKIVFKVTIENEQ